MSAITIVAITVGIVCMLGYLAVWSQNYRRERTTRRGWPR